MSADKNFFDRLFDTSEKQAKYAGTLTLYACDSCGAVSLKNFRDGSCAVCRVAMKVSQIDVAAPIKIAPAPHTEEPEA